ncbi:MAG: PDZ domain-containing protein [Clostridia bacterium]|nr:PDZ domain-containing protein [Clostridia bacterium]
MNEGSGRTQTARRHAMRAILCCLLIGLFSLMPFPLQALPVGEESVQVVPGGEAFGVRLKTEGAMIYRVEENSPAQRAGALPGDVIVRACGKKVPDAPTLSEIIRFEKSDRIVLKILRGGRPARLTVRRASKDEPLGLAVRDTLSGIGTVSFYLPETGVFGGLGHGVCAKSDGQLLPLDEGSVTGVRLTSVVKGTPGHPGQLRGLFYPGQTGSVTLNAPTGIYGRTDVIPKRQAVPAATPREIECGEATILCTVDGEGVRSYAVTVEKIISFDEQGKNFLIHVNDPRLLEIAGGIVQGMSGSPILQNGRIIGAVTHVLLEDPTRGYGIYIGNMLKNSETAKNAAAPKENGGAEKTAV